MLVMPGLVPGIHVFLLLKVVKTCMAGTRARPDAESPSIVVC